MDDGSTDGTLSICREYAARDGRIRYVNQENQGVAAARNRLLDMATGEWIVFIDADDYVTPDYLTGFDSMENAGADVLICGRYMVRNGIVRTIRPVSSDGDLYYHKLLERAWNISNVWGKAIRRSLVISRQARFPEHINQGEDLYFLVVLLYQTRNIVVDNRPRYYYCMHEDSITHNPEYLRDDIRCTLAIDEFISSKPDAEDYRLSLNRGRMQMRQKWYLAVRKNDLDASSHYVFNDVCYDGLRFPDKIRLFCVNHDLFFVLRAFNKIVKPS